MLNTLTNAELKSRVETLISKERLLTSKLLAHLGEFDARRLYAIEGYPSMFQYLVDGLRYSEPAAARRVKAARLVRERPELLPLVESGELHLTALHMMASHINDESKLCVFVRSSYSVKKSLAVIGATPSSV